MHKYLPENVVVSKGKTQFYGVATLKYCCVLVLVILLVLEILLYSQWEMGCWAEWTLSVPW